MKTILVYTPEKVAIEGHKELRKSMLNYLRREKVPYGRNQDLSIIIGETKVLFYDASGGYRNDKVFIRNHPVIDAVFYTSPTIRLNSVDDDNLVYQSFCQGKEIPILSENKKRAFCQLTQVIDEIKKEAVFEYRPSEPSVQIVDVPVGLKMIFHFPLSDKDGVIKLMSSHLDHQTEKITKIERKLSLEKKKAERLFQNIGSLKQLDVTRGMNDE